MNRVFKVVWNVANGTWVVTSELGKSRGKNRARLNVAKMAALGAVVGAMTLGTAQADQCVYDGHELNGKECTAPLEVTTPGSYIINDVKFTLDADHGYPRFAAISVGEDNAVLGNLGDKNKLTIHDLTLANSVGRSGIWVATNWEDGDAIINLNGENSIVMTGNTDTAVLAEVIGDDGTGNASINVTGELNISHTETTFGQNTFGYDIAGHDITDGLEVRAKADYRKNGEEGAAKTAAVTFIGKGSIATKGGNAVIAEISGGSGDVVVDLKADGGDISLSTNSELGHGEESHGIKAESSDFWGVAESDITVVTGANIHIQGLSGKGIFVDNGAEKATTTITNNGNITVDNKDNHEGHGIYSNIAKAGTTTLKNEGNIITKGAYADGIRVEGNGKTDVTHDTGEITSNHYGISVEQALSDVETKVTSNGVIDASEGLGGVFVNAAGKSIIDLNEESEIKGGTAFGVQFEGGKTTLTNLGSIESKNDLAISAKAADGSKIINKVGNNGVGLITGSIISTGKLDFENEGTFALRSVEDGVRNVALSNFEGGEVNNKGMIKFADSSHVTSLQTDLDEYKTKYGIHQTMESGALQGHLTGVSKFSNEGTLDLRSGKAGNILRITGKDGETGTYVANGGKLLVNTVLNAGGNESISDVLVVDNVELGTKATNIDVYVADGSTPGIKTENNGILLVQALGKDINTKAFELTNGSFIYGKYEYSLVGINDDQAGENGFYLQNGMEKTNRPDNKFGEDYPINKDPVDPNPGDKDPVDPKPGDKDPVDPKPGDKDPVDPKPGDKDPVDPKPEDKDPEDKDPEDPNKETENTGGNKKPSGVQYSPNVGAYLGMQYAAATMFNQNILDRRDNVRRPDETVWGRIQYSNAKTNHLHQSQSLKIDNMLIQLGWDLFQNEEKTSVFGLYVGYGHSDVKNRSLRTGTEAKGTVAGYQLGAYYSWMRQEEVGPYVDVWGHIAKYRSKMTGKTQNYREVAYNGTGYSVSLEVGHGFVVHQSDNNDTQWVLEPHAQATYNYLSNKDMIDGTNTSFTNNRAKGLDLRLGARFYGYRDNNDALRPYVELNWLHNGTDNAVHVNGEKVSSRIGKNVMEIKLGAQGHVSKDTSIFAHLGYQKGKDKFKRTEVQVGINYNF